METVAKPARLGPAKNDAEHEKLVELSMFYIHEEKCTEKVAERMLKINMELIKYKNANVTT